MEHALGTAWDEELECYRRGIEVEKLPLRISI